MQTDTIHIDSKKRIIKQQTKTINEEVKESLFLKWVGYFVFFVLPIISFMIYERGNVELASRLVIFSMLLMIASILSYLSILTDKRHFRPIKSSPSIENKKGVAYQLAIGKEVKRFKGSGVLSSNKKNLTGKFVLLDSESIKRMGATIGTTGSGKTVQLEGMFEQQVSLGGGAMVIEGKGTKDELKKLYAIVGKYNRLNDMYILNFSNLNNTHSVNIFKNTSADQLKEIFSELIENTEQTWKVVINDFVVSVLRLLVYKRDKYGINFGFNELSSSLSRNFLWDEAKRYRKVIDDDTENDDLLNFLRFFLGSFDMIDFNKFLTYDDPIILKEGVDTSSLNEEEQEVYFFWKLADESILEPRGQGSYELGLAIKNWSQIFITLGSTYKNIFNDSDPDFSLFEAVQSNKIIIVSVPSLQSDIKNKQVGKLLLGMIRAVALEKSLHTYESSIPYLFLFDEAGSYIVKGLARFMSKARALSMSIWLFFQSDAQLKDISDNERDEIFDMLHTLIIMKTLDPKIPEYLSKLVSKKYIIEQEFKENNRILPSMNKKENDKNFHIRESQQYTSHELSSMNEGEAITIISGVNTSIVALPPSDMTLTFQKYNISSNLPIFTHMGKNIFIKNLKNLLDY
ncbi:MAG TPA: hypothetical protein EYG73_10675 [Arcobacter sp.]|nr:hypothetical protein [Arcobacter sp.]